MLIVDSCSSARFAHSSRSVASPGAWIALVTGIAVGALGCHGGSGTGGSAATGGSGTGGSPASGGMSGLGGASATGGAGAQTTKIGSGGASGPSSSGGSSGAGGSGGRGTSNDASPSDGSAGPADAPADRGDARPMGADGKAAGGAGGASAGGAGGKSGAGGATVAADGGGTAGKPYKGTANCTCAERTSLKVSWYYNWTVTPDNCSTGGEFVPMYSNHPNTNPTPQAVTDQIDKLVSAGYPYVLGFNEPNKSDQANMTVADAIALWPAMTSNPAILVGSPATSADGQSWFQDFWKQVQAQNLRVDFVALHWYGWNAGSCDANAANLESYIKWAENLTGSLPLWLTEWGCMNDSNPDDATVQAFFQGAVKMFAKHPRLERYAWYQWDPYNHLTNDDHSLTALGQIYASEPATK